MSRAVNELARTIRADAAADPYACYHAPRYAVALELVRPFVQAGRSRVLDVGPSRLTALLHSHFQVVVDSLGFEVEGPTPTGRHYHFDLNLAQEEASFRTDLPGDGTDLPGYDLVVLAEVIEHLHTSPKLVLTFLRRWLAPSGVLLIQTPNAVALTKRLKLLVGRHPYEKIRENAMNPGHFREYTAGELREYATLAGFDVLHCRHYNYFDCRFSGHAGSRTPRWIEAVKYAALHAVPPSLKPGISLVLRRR